MSNDKNRLIDELTSTEFKQTTTIGHVEYYLIDKTSSMFHFYAKYTTETGRVVVAEMYYDLRNKEHYIKRNGKEVKFTVNNLDEIVPRRITGARRDFNTRDSIDKFVDFVETDENKGMYNQMLALIGSIGNEKRDMTSRALIRLMNDYNKLELLYKAGVNLEHFDSDKVLLHWVLVAGQKNVTKAHEILKLTKNQFKAFKEFSNNEKFPYNVISYISSLEVQDVSFYRYIRGLVEKLQDKYQVYDRLEVFDNNMSLKDFAELRQYTKNGYAHYMNWSGWSLLDKPYITNEARLIEYLAFECLLSQGMELGDAITTYRDYVNMNRSLGNHTYNKYPKYLKTYHDIVSRNYKLVEDTVLVEKFEARRIELQNYECKVGAFAFIAPKTMRDIATEGSEQSHCVASYARQVAEGTTDIIFMRLKKKPEKSLITMEIQNGRVVQARGFANRNPDEEEMVAIEKFKNIKKLR
ncbi:PcfJ-like protein [Bacillus phage Kamfam]|nr:hypothetical protein OTK52_54 [Bacillus phage OTooleKemple52]AXQ67271.1 PcfJ-like protein [Bacillus phage Kamfam]